MPLLSMAASENDSGSKLSKEYIERLERHEQEKESKKESGSIHISDDGSEKAGTKEYSNSIETSIKAAQTSIENAFDGIIDKIILASMEGAINIFEADVEEDGYGTVTYDIHTRAINPYDHPLVIPIQLVSFGYLLLTSIFTILGSVILSAFQTKYPETYGGWKRSASGVYEPYDPKRVHKTCVWATTRPCIAFIGFLLVLIVRNHLILSMPQTAPGVLSTTTDNFIIQLITGISIFIGAFQTTFGELGVYAFSTFIFIMYIISDFVILANHPETANKLEHVAWGAFLLFCFCDIINMFSISFGVITSEWLGNPIYITCGIVGGAFINFVLLAVLTIVVIFKGKRAFGV